MPDSTLSIRRNVRSLPSGTPASSMIDTRFGIDRSIAVVSNSSPIVSVTCCRASISPRRASRSAFALPSSVTSYSTLASSLDVSSSVRESISRRIRSTAGLSADRLPCESAAICAMTCPRNSSR